MTMMIQSGASVECVLGLKLGRAKECPPSHRLMLARKHDGEGRSEMSVASNFDSLSLSLSLSLTHTHTHKHFQAT